MNIIPVIGSRGRFSFATPITNFITDGVEYSCEGVRRINDYVASNEDVKEIAYTPYGISDAVYNEDVAENAYIVSLQSAKGHWLYIPYRYILSYHTGDGVVYRSQMLVFSLPPIASTVSLESLLTDAQSLIAARLGVTPNYRVVESSQPTLVSYEKHVETQTARDLLKTQQSSAAEIYRLTQLVQKLTEENTILKNYVESL